MSEALILACTHVVAILAGYITGRMFRRANIRRQVEEEKEKFTKELKSRLQSVFRLFD